MILTAINRIKVLREFYKKKGEKWTNGKMASFTHFLPKEAKVLDLGCGNCMISSNLSRRGYQVTALDIKNLSIIEDVAPVVYDGQKIPFENDSFDTVLLLTVLHHSEAPKQLIQEAKRVAKHIVIIEDTFKNNFQKRTTQLVDTLVNFGHSKMTFQNKSETEWELEFAKENLTVLSKTNKSVLFFFQQTTYHLGR